MNYRAFGTKATRTGNGDYEFALTSEAPVERVFGIEILEHSERAINFERLGDGRHPLLVNHESGSQVGVVQRAWFDASSKNVRVSTRFSKSQRAQEIKQDVEDDIRTLVSAGYMIDEVVEEREEDDGTKSVRTIDGETFEREMRAKHGEHFYRSADPSTRSKNSKPYTYTVTRWTPFEASIVEVPADITVGKGRAIQPAAATSPTKEAGMEKEKDASAGATAVIVEPTKEEHRHDPVEYEKNRKRAIENLCRINKLDDKYKDHWIGSGLSIEEVSDDILRIMEERGKTNPQPASRLGLTSKETQQFSIMRAVKAICDKDWTHAPFELECSRSVAQKLGKVVDPGRFFVPFEVMQRPVELPVERLERMLGRRDLTVGTAGAGGYLVATNNVGFIEILRNRSVVSRMGARRLPGLQGSVAVPRQSAAGTAYWLSTEATAITESQQTFVQMALSPKNVGAYTEISRQLLLQSSPGAEGIVTDDLAQVVAIAVDLAALNGSGASGQPTGVINTSGIGAVTGASLGYAGVLEFQTDVAGSNVMPTAGGYVTTPAVSSLMMQRARFSNTDTPLWVGNIWDGAMAGFPAMSSNQVPSANMLFGDWQELVIGEWGVLEVEVNPYANFAAGIIGVRAIYSMDVGVRRPFAFSLATSIT